MAKKPAPAKLDFKFIDKPVKPVRRSVACLCKRGTLEFTGLVEDGPPPAKYVHECAACKTRYSFADRYPTVVFVGGIPK